MLKRVLAGVAVAVMLAAGVAGPLHAAEEILSYDATVVVRDDGVLDVIEAIRVRAEGNRIKRGIYRDFPLTFVDDDGRHHKVSFELLDVTRNGKPEPYHTTSNNRGIRIYAGQESVFLADRVYTYAFHYETGRQIRFLPEHTELFWNVTGNEWAFPILKASARIKLPDGRAPVRWTAYTGRFGEHGEDFTGGILGDNALSVTTTDRLVPGEGLSVVVEIPPGLIAPPSGRTELYYWYLDNHSFVLGGLGLFGLLVFYVGIWLAVGRDPPKGTIIPLFHPPKGISPALAGYIHNWGWSGGWRTFTAAVISLAVKGLLVFDDSEDTIVLSRTEKQLPAELPPGERAILDWVNKHKGRVALVEEHVVRGESIAKALKKFRANIENENRHRFFKRNFGYFVAGLVMTAVALLLILFSDASTGFSDLDFGLSFFVVFMSVIIGIIILHAIRVLTASKLSVTSIIWVALMVPVVLFIFISIIGDVYQPPDNFIGNIFPFALVGSFAAMNGLFYYLLRAPTAAGRKVMDQIEGLELYIRTAETARLNAAGAPELTAEQFERLLPYAVALEAEKPWSEAFAAAFARAHPGEDMEAAYAPDWHGGHGWSGGDFGRSVCSTVSAAQSSFASAIPAPSSSSSGFSGGGFGGGGGGFSGGGGGGGGGGGW